MYYAMGEDSVCLLCCENRRLPYMLLPPARFIHRHTRSLHSSLPDSIESTQSIESPQAKPTQMPGKPNQRRNKPQKQEIVLSTPLDPLSFPPQHMRTAGIWQHIGHDLPVLKDRSHLHVVGHNFPGDLETFKGGMESFHTHVGARAEQDQVAPGFVPGSREGYDVGEGRELVVGMYADGGVNGDGTLEEEGLGESEAAICEVDAATVIAPEEGELGHDHGGGNDDLHGNLGVDQSCVDAGARPSHKVANPVRDRAVSHEDKEIFCLHDSKFPSFRPNISLQASYACRQLTKCLGDTIRGCNHES